MSMDLLAALSRSYEKQLQNPSVNCYPLNIFMFSLVDFHVIDMYS